MEGGTREHVQHGRTSKFDELSQLWDGYSDVICVGPNCPILPRSRRGYAEATRARVYACLFCVTAGAPYHLLGLLSTPCGKLLPHLSDQASLIASFEFIPMLQERLQVILHLVNHTSGNN